MPAKTETVTCGGSRAVFTQGGGFTKRKAWNSDGILQSSITCNTKTGKRHGKCMWWDKAGNLEQVIRYKSNRLQGLSTMYTNGILSSSKYFKNNRIHGRSRKWRHGQLISDMNYKNGVLHGRYRCWSATGKLLEDMVY